MNEMSKWVRVVGVHPQWSEREQRTYKVGEVRSTEGWPQADYDLLLSLQVIEPCDPPFASAGDADTRRK